MTIEAGPSPEDFITKFDIEFAATGTTLTRTGKGIVYTGYSWRGPQHGTCRYSRVHRSFKQSQ
jgi:quinohemoprotein amine dehydrogenase